MTHAKMSYEQLEAAYFDQCAATDRFAEKAREGGDQALKERIAELEQQLATVNARLITQNTETACLTKSAPSP